MEIYSPNFLPEQNKGNKKRIIVSAILIILVLAAGYGALRLGLAYHTIEVKSDSNRPLLGKIIDILALKEGAEEPTPTPEKDRIDILILGIRGPDDPDFEQGGLLTDTIILYSFDRTTKKSAIVSIPRDLYIQIEKNKMDKINAVYEYGLADGDAITFTKKVFSIVTGVHIDNVIVFDFSSFKEIVDAIGGIDIYLSQPFEEKTQWGNPFYLPAGQNHLDGQAALYYVRSRYSTSDFDRSRRQQQIIMAIKDKLLKLNYLSDPLKALNVINAIKNSIKTDVNIWDIKNLFTLVKEIDQSKPKEYVISIENLVYQSYINNIYVLLPKGDNFSQIKQFFQDIIK